MSYVRCLFWIAVTVLAAVVIGLRDGWRSFRETLS